MKLRKNRFYVWKRSVTSYAEVWIEIGVAANVKAVGYVTSYAEVWIEIKCNGRQKLSAVSHLLRGGVD